MSRNPDGSVLALSSAADEAMEGFKWHQPPPVEPATATALVSLTPVAPTRGGAQHQHQPPQNNNQDVINLQYMELEEFLLENAVQVTVPEQKAYPPLHEDLPHSQHPHHGGPHPPHHQQPHPVSLEQRPPAGYPGPSLANNVLQIMSGPEVKREQDVDSVLPNGAEEADPLVHRGSHPMTPPEHQNDVIMKVGRSIGRTMSGPANVLQPATEHVTATSTILTPSTRRTNSLCEPQQQADPHMPAHLHPGHHQPHHHAHSSSLHGGSISPPGAHVVLEVNTSPNRAGEGMDNCLALSPSSSASSTSSSDGGSGSSGHMATRATRGASAAASAGGRSSRVALAMQSSVVAAAAAAAAAGATSPRGSSAASRRLKKEPVPEHSKDDKYWKRRAKNNAAAKRSRDLRREKENSILTRVQFLEGQNQILNQTLIDMKQENADLKERLARYEAV